MTRRNLPFVAAIALFVGVVVGAVVWIGAGVGAASPVPLDGIADLRPERIDPASLSLDDLRTRARAAGDCGAVLDLWWEITRRAPDDVEAWREIARCEHGDEIDTVVDGTTRAFEESRVLGVVPSVLDALDVKDVVPILNQVQARPGNDVSDLLLIGKLRRDVGDAAGAVSAFKQALALAPDDVESNLAYGYALVDQGEIEAARPVFRNAIAHESPELKIARLYAIAVGWPFAFVGAVVGLVGLGATLATRGIGRDAIAIIATAVATTAALGGYFYEFGDRVAFAVLALAATAAAGWILLSPLRAPISRAAAVVWRNVGLIAAGRIHREVQRLPVWAQGVLLAACGLVVVFGIPLVPSIDARLVLLFLTSMLLFSTLGSLLLGLLERSSSLRQTLWWLGAAGTLPFLVFFLYVERVGLVRALWGGTWLSHEDQNRLAGYFLVWMAGLGLALLLARILATSILDPLGRVMSVIERVRAGDYAARAALGRGDELGALGSAVDEMAEGLAQRDAMKATFKRYVNPEVADRLMDGDDVRGRLLHATVLFADVRGFTAFSEKVPAERVVDLLNEYFARMEPVIRRWGGVVDKFLGDGILAVWDVPAPKADGPLAGVRGERLAVEAAVSMLETLAAFNEELAARGLPPLEIGMGIHSGPLIAGPVGSPDRQEYTVIGDTVNTAQRVEGVARDGVALLVTSAVADVVKPYADVEEQPPVRLKGKREAVVLFRVVGLRERLAA